MPRPTELPELQIHDPFPAIDQAWGPDTPAPGLLAVGADLSVGRLTQAYQRGIFPWFSQGQPILWWSPQPRMVLKVENFKLSKSFKKTLKAFVTQSNYGNCAVRIDTAFEQVIHYCAHTPRQGQAGTWIVPAMQAAYIQWHQAGAVHSFETWVHGQLVGGLYGVCLGRMFFGESMFALQTNASKVALAALVGFCRSHGIDWIDCQQNTRHLASFGAAEVSRVDFQSHLVYATAFNEVDDWVYQPAYMDRVLVDHVLAA
jgi:leucyl/phenylalanyl-tRNA--protein transferase